MTHRGSSCLLFAVLILAACSSPTPTPAALPYIETFDNPASGWKTVSDKAIQIQYQDGALHFKIDELDSIAWSVPGRRFTDFVLDVDASQVDGPDDNGYGVIVRYVDDRDFYRMDISGDGYFDVMKYKAGVWIKLQDWTESAAIQQGIATNHLRVIATGSQLTFIVNDQTLARITDGDFKQGDVGLAAGTFFDHAGVHIAFDNLKLTEVRP